MSEENQTNENVQAEETTQTEPQAENVQAQPEVGAEVPADAQPMPEQPATPTEETTEAVAPEGGSGEAPAEAGSVEPTVTQPVNQPETAEPTQPEEEKKPEQDKPSTQELVSEYTYGVYHKGNDSAEAFTIELAARSSKVNDTVTMLLKENVENVEDYTIRLKNIRLISVYRGQ